MPTAHPIESLLATAMESIKSMVDVNTILGDPVETADGTVILPVSRVSFGFAAGGKEFGSDGGIQDSGEYSQSQGSQPAQSGIPPFRAAPPAAPGQAQGQGQGQGSGTMKPADPYAAAQGQGQGQPAPSGQSPPAGTVPIQQGQMTGQGQGQAQGQQPQQQPSRGRGSSPATGGWAAFAGAPSRVSSYPFGGGSGAGVSLFPVAFLVVQKNEVRLITVDQRSAFYDRLLDLVPKVLQWIRPSPPPVAPEDDGQFTDAEPVSGASALARDHTPPTY